MAFVLSLLLFCLNTKAQSLEELEYFIDKEPGVGNATSVSISPADTIQKSWSIPIAGLSDGQHFLYIRIKDSSGLWSPWQIQLFFIEDTINIGNIEKLEYFTDKEPGAGKGTDISITQGQSVQTEFQRSSQGMNQGRHYMHVRAKVKNGAWSPWQFQMFYIEDTIDVGPITDIEYFVGMEPRLGKGTGLTFTPADSVAMEITKSINTFPLGRNFFHVRSKIRSGLWGPWQLQMFYIEDTINTGPINKMEYFVGREPGPGKGKNISIITGDTVKTEFTSGSSSLQQGRNYIHVRSKISSGLWSPWQFQMIYLEDTINHGPINKMEYFIDKDPGIEKGTPISISSADTVKKNLTYNTSPLNPGRHYFHVRTKNQFGMWSPWQFQMFLLEDKKDTGKIIRYSYSIDSSLLKLNYVKNVFLNPAKDTLNKTHFEKTDTALRLGRHYFRIWTLQDTRIRSTWHFDTFDVINCPMLDTAIIKTPIGFCANDTLIFKQDITRLGIWPKDSFNFSWKVNGNSVSNLDTLKYRHNGGDSFKLSFSFAKKNDSRCKGSLEKPIILFPSPNDTFRISICNGDSSLIHGTYRKSSGTFDFNGSSFRNCDSFARVILDVKPIYRDTFRLSICADDSALIHGKYRKSAGTYLLDTSSTIGCDSMAWVILKVNPVYFSPDSFRICQGDTLFRHGKAYTAQGIYLDTFSTIFGCDSVFITSVFTDPTYNDSSKRTICLGDSSFIHGLWRKSSAFYTFKGNTYKGCDSTSIVQLIVNPSYHLNQNISLCQGDSALIHGQYRKQSGIYTHNGVTTLGCDSIVNIQVIVNPIYQFTDSFELCNGDTLKTHGKNYSSTGIYRDTFKTVNGCDSIYITKLKIHPTYRQTLKIGICSNDSFLFDGIYRHRSDTIIGHFNTLEGCDSIVTLFLKVDSVINTETFPEICEGDSIFIGGAFRKSKGDYIDVYTALKGCDSIVIRHLQIIKKDTTHLPVTLCQRETLSYHGNSYGDTGTYIVKLISYRGCDSIVFLRIDKIPEIRNIFSRSVCHGEGFFAGKSMKFGSGTFFDTLKAQSGCDSIVIYTQTERATDSGYLTISICEGDSIFTGKTWKKLPGNYSDTLRNRFACDSIIFTILSNRPISSTDIFDTICHGESISFNGNTISSSGSYKKTLNNFTGCDSTVTLHLHKRPQFVPKIIADGFARLMTEKPYAGYQWFVDRVLLQGDTLRKVDVVKSGVYDVSVTDSIGCKANSWDDLLSNGSLTYEWPITAYPNPADETLILKSTQNLKLEVYNGTGIRIYRSDIEIGENILNISEWTEGIYHLRVDNGSSIFTISVVVLH